VPRSEPSAARQEEVAETVPTPRLPAPLRTLLREVEPILSEKPRAKVAVLADESTGAVVDVLRSRHPRLRLTVVPPAGIRRRPLCAR